VATFSDLTITEAVTHVLQTTYLRNSISGTVRI
jgi:hypothetical protein